MPLLFRGQAVEDCREVGAFFSAHARRQGDIAVDSLLLHRSRERHAGSRKLEIVAALTFGRNLDPPFNRTLRAFLHGWEIYHLAHRQVRRQVDPHHELVVFVISQIAALPHHFLHAFRRRAAVVVVGFLVGAAYLRQGPAGLRHRLDGK